MMAGDHEETTKLRSIERLIYNSFGLNVTSSNAMVAIAFVNDLALTTKFYVVAKMREAMMSMLELMNGPP